MYQLENTLRNVKGIRDVAIISRSSPIDGAANMHAFVCSTDNSIIDAAAVVNSMRVALPVRIDFILVPAGRVLPRNFATGKLDTR